MEPITYTLKTILDAIVTNPLDVKIAESHDDRGVLLTLDVHPSDMGRVIGKNGETAKAIRTVIRVIGMQHSERVSIKINEPDGGR